MVVYAWTTQVFVRKCNCRRGWEEEMGMGGKEMSPLLYRFVLFDIFNHVQLFLLKRKYLNFPGFPVVKTLCFKCRKHKFYPWWGN